MGDLPGTGMPVLSEDSGLHETLALLTSQLRPDSNHREEMGFLRDVFSEKSLSYLMKIHEKLRYYERQSPTPVLHSAMALAEDVMEELQAASVHGDERELLQLLSTPHLRVVMPWSPHTHTAVSPGTWDGGGGSVGDGVLRWRGGGGFCVKDPERCSEEGDDC